MSKKRGAAEEESKHIQYRPTYKLHKPENEPSKLEYSGQSNEYKDSDYDGGACLLDHQPYYYEKYTCSYRWQGLRNLKKHADIYNRHNGDNMGVGQKKSTGIRADLWESNINYNNSAKTITTFKGFVNKSVMEKTGDGKEQIVKKKMEADFFKVEMENFTHNKVPYDNNAHHIIPKATLYLHIKALADEYYKMRDIIINDLLLAEYNINHYDNIIILPAQDKAALLTGLPKHKGGHKKYNEYISEKVKEAFLPYREYMEELKESDENCEECEKPDKNDLKDTLIKISKKMYKTLIETSNKLVEENRKEAKKEFLAIHQIDKILEQAK